MASGDFHLTALLYHNAAREMKPAMLYKKVAATEFF